MIRQQPRTGARVQAPSLARHRGPLGWTEQFTSGDARPFLTIRVATERVRLRRRSIRPVACAVALCAVVGAGCTSPARVAQDRAREEYLENLRLSKTGGSFDERLVHLDRCLQFQPAAADCLEERAIVHLNAGQLAESRADFDRAIALADRPYLHFERADLLCAAGEPALALADLDQAIQAQPENLQFYPRRAQARVATGSAAQAREDLARAGAPVAGTTGASILLLEGRPDDALRVLDAELAQTDHPDPSDRALARLLRMLANAALGRDAAVRAEFGPERLAAARQWPEQGFEYWIVPRGCSNAFVLAREPALLARMRGLLAHGAPAASAAPGAPTAAMPVTAGPAIFWVDSSTTRSAFVQMPRTATGDLGSAPDRLQLLDEHGLRAAERVAVRRECLTTATDSDDCLWIAEYRYSGVPMAAFAAGFAAPARIAPVPMPDAELPRAAQLEHLASLFASPPPPPVDAATIFSWHRTADDWAEQYVRREEASPGKYRVATTQTGVRFADCTLAVRGPLTEIRCQRMGAGVGWHRTSVYLGQRRLGGLDASETASAILYAAEIDGTLAYFVRVEHNSEETLRVVSRVRGEWRVQELRSARPGD